MFNLKSHGNLGKQCKEESRPSTATRQMKAMGLGEAEKLACTVAPHGCHPQSQCHSHQEKQNDTCTYRKKENAYWLCKHLTNFFQFMFDVLHFGTSSLGFGHAFVVGCFEGKVHDGQTKDIILHYSFFFFIFIIFVYKIPPKIHHPNAVLAASV